MKMEADKKDKIDLHKLSIRLFLICICIVSLGMLGGCSKKYTTVADDISGGNTEYIEIEKIAVKTVQDLGRESIGYLSVLIPSDFVKSDEVEGMYISSLYPVDSSNICYSVQDPLSLGVIDDNLTKEDYKKAIEEAFRSLNDPIELNIDSFLKEDMNGIPCFKIASHYAHGDRQIQQIIYIVLADETYVITYSQLSDDELMVDFVNYDGDITLVRERSNA